MNNQEALQLNLNLTLTVDEINAVLVALQELPGKVCNPLSEKIKQQAVPQLQAAESSEKGRTITKDISEGIATEDRVG